MIRPKLILSFGVVFMALFLVRTYLDPIHSASTDALRKPGLSAYPRLQRHCCFCPRCRERCGLVPSDLLKWESPSTCDEGIRVFIEDVKEKWE